MTSPARTAFDLGRRYGSTLAVIRLDALMQATELKTADVDALIDRHRGARGIVQLREAISLADSGAESPQETRTRLVLTAAGLRPQRTQIDVFDRFGEHVGRIDMGWTAGRSASSTTASNTGRIRPGGRATSTVRPNSRRWAGGSPVSAPTCCATGPAP